MKNHSANGINRRRFLVNTTLGVATLQILPSGIVSGAERISPNDKLNIAGIGVGYQGGGDIDAMADELVDYQRNPDLRARHGAAGLEFAKTMDWDHINAAVMHVYERVIERRQLLNRRLGLGASRP